MLPTEPDLLHEHLAARRAQGPHMNLDFLGEALLGEDEARGRLEKHPAALQSPDVEVLSVKISTIDSQILPIAREHTLGRLCDRLELPYKAASRGNKFLYLDMEEYRDLSLKADAFMRTLSRPGLERVRVGSAHELRSRVGPLIRPAAGALEEALKTLEPGETWAVMPARDGGNPQCWSPGVKYGVTHLTEFFGPLLGVVPFEKPAEAIEIVNATGYGLTSAIHSLDDREIEQWKRGIRAGNLYVNRGTTGAI